MSILRKACAAYLLLSALWGSHVCRGQGQEQPLSTAQLRLHVTTPRNQKHHAIPAVVWFEPLAGTPTLPFPSHAPYTLLQKNRTFVPHLQVIPVGSSVQFPNADPFFHNVFSLFDGKRFDLGLYEAGSSRSVTFARVGVSYIFCNIHPEMSAVVLSLSTPLFAVADEGESFTVRNMPAGDYKVNVWVEGVPQAQLDRLAKRVHIDGSANDLGSLDVAASATAMEHENKFGKPYDRETKTSY